MNKLRKNGKGITLIALVVTIVVLLILAGVSISMLTGDNGIITQAQNAKNQTVIGKEKESIDLAKVAIYSRDEEIAEDNMQNELDEIEGTNKTDVKLSEDGKSLEIKFLDSGNIYYVDINQTTEDGNYVIDGTIYCSTLTEALEKAQDGDTITVVKDSVENEMLTINKNITLNTNGKTITYSGENKITVEESKKMIINGNGTITGESSTSIILCYGDMETSNVTIEGGHLLGYMYSTIVVLDSGKLTSNNCSISGITTEGEITINGGKYKWLAGYPSGSPGTFIINDATISEIGLSKGGTVQINSGKIGEIILSNDSADIYLTIGDSNNEVSNTNPEVQKISIVAPDLTCITAVINFYNGIIKECFFDLSTEFEIGSSEEDTFNKYSIRTGYKTQTTEDGTILVEN